MLCAESNLPTYGISGKVGSTDVPRGEALHLQSLLSSLASLQQIVIKIRLYLQERYHRA